MYRGSASVWPLCRSLKPLHFGWPGWPDWRCSCGAGAAEPGSTSFARQAGACNGPGRQADWNYRGLRLHRASPRRHATAADSWADHHRSGAAPCRPPTPICVVVGFGTSSARPFSTLRATPHMRNQQRPSRCDHCTSCNQTGGACAAPRGFTTRRTAYHYTRTELANRFAGDANRVDIGCEKNTLTGDCITHYRNVR